MLRQTLNSAAIVLCALATAAHAARCADDLAVAQSLLLKGRYEDAAERFAAMASSDPNAALGLARCKLETGKRKEAEIILRLATEQFPRSAAVRAELALAALASGDHDTAQRHADEALA